MEKRCAYASDAAKIAGVVDSTGESEEARKKFRVIPHKPLTLGTQWRFAVHRRADGHGGPAGPRDRRR